MIVKNDAEITAVYKGEDDISAIYRGDSLIWSAVPAVWKTVTGNPVTFSDGANASVKSLSVAIEQVQSGSGDPSPSNVRPISGWDAVEVTVNLDTVNIALPSAAGTVYGGTLDVTTGVLTVTHKRWNLRDLSFSKYSTYNIYYTTGMTDKAAGTDNLISNAFHYKGSHPRVQMVEGEMDGGNTLYFSLGDSFTTAAAFKAECASKGYYVVGTLATPVTYQLTPTEVRTLLGNNYFSADCGDVTVTYRALS